MKRKFGVLFLIGVLLAFSASTGFTKSKAKSDHGWLGIYTQSVDYGLAEAFDLGVKYGAVVNEVVDDSPADKAGLKEDDVIIALDGKKVTDENDLVYLIDDYKVGDKVTLTIVRDGAEMKVNATLEKSPRNQIIFDSDESPQSFSFSFNNEERGYLGVTDINLTEQLGEYFGVGDDKGVLVTSVSEDSPAEKAELKAGDVIIAVDDEKVTDTDDLAEIIGDHEKGDKVTVAIIRDGRQKKIDVELDETDEKDFFSSRAYKFNGSWLNNMLRFSDIPMPDFNEEEVREELEQFRDELRQLKQELKKSKKSLNKQDKSEIQELRKELRKLQSEMEDMRKKLE